MKRRIERTSFEEFVRNYVAQHPHEHLGKKFLFVHFPGHEDVDITEDDDLHRVLSHIEDRYVLIEETGSTPHRFDAEILEAAIHDS